MIIETEPCENCDFSLEYCSCDIDICQITRGRAMPISEERYEAEKMRIYQKTEIESRWDNSEKRWWRERKIWKG